MQIHNRRVCVSGQLTRWQMAEAEDKGDKDNQQWVAGLGED